MKIAVASSNGENVDLHLGKGYSLYIYSYENDDLTFIEHRKVDIDLESQHQGSKVITACEDCDVIIAAQYGFKSKIKADQQSDNTETRQDNGELLAYLRDIVFLIAGILLVFSLSVIPYNTNLGLIQVALSLVLFLVFMLTGNNSSKKSYHSKI